MKYQRSKVGAVRFRRVRLLLLVVLCTFLGTITTFYVAWVATTQLPVSPPEIISFLPREKYNTIDGLRQRNWGATYASGNFINEARFELERRSITRIDFFQRLRESDLSAATAEQQFVCKTPEEWWLGVRSRLDPGVNDWSFDEMCNKILNAEEIYGDGATYGNEKIGIAVAGWPQHAFRAISINRMNGIVSDPMLPKSGKLLGFSWNFKEDLPIKPIWRGFLINTSLYTLAWFVVVVGISQTIRKYQRFRRVRLGLCVECRYDLKGSPIDVPCPECGALRHTPAVQTVRQ